MALEKVSLNGQEFPAVVLADNGDNVDVVLFGYNDLPASIVKAVPKSDTVEESTNVLVFVYADLEVAASDATNSDSVSGSVDTTPPVQ